jgi:hypothetical protein
MSAVTLASIKLFDQSMRFARIGERQIPIIHQLDHAARPPRPNGLLSGKILMIQNDVMAIQTINREIFYIKVPPFEQLSSGFTVGDHVTVFGIIHDDQVDAQMVVKQ